MYSSYIQEAAAAMADRMNQSPVPLYGSKLRLPNRQAVILLIKEIRKLMFPAYFGDPELMSLAPADYAALILERVEAQLRAQIALALPESEANRAAEVAREIIERMPYIHYHQLPLPPIYGWKNGYLCGTHPWPARQWTGSIENGWREVYDIDPSIVLAAAEKIDSARAFLKGVQA